jgi:hypothetical protein
MVGLRSEVLMDEFHRRIQSLPPEALAAVLPPYLRERPTDPVALAHYLLWAEAGDHPDSHLPCRPGQPRGCDACWEKSEAFREEAARLPYEQMVHPNEEREARNLISYWYALGALTGVPVIVHGLPMFDSTRVPRPHR